MPDQYFARYLPLLIHICVAAGLASAIVTASWLIGQHKFNKSKMSQYECGMQPVGDAKQRFSVKFYLVAMLFIVFDVESVFIYPWGALLRDFQAEQLGWFAYFEMLSFMATLALGLVYVWRKGALEWS